MAPRATPTYKETILGWWAPDLGRIVKWRVELFLCSRFRKSDVYDDVHADADRTSVDRSADERK